MSWVTVKLMAELPTFDTVYCSLSGLNGPPAGPVELKLSGGVTTMLVPEPDDTASCTARVVLPAPLVAFVNVIVSL